MIDTAKINEKKQDLEKAKKNLKSYFVGLDEVIDRLIELIEVWYLIPDVLMRPVIINLWGMTGIGKTDLVRKLVSELHFTDRYAEIQFDANNKDRSIQNNLLHNNILSNTQAILLLDEFQKFCTINKQDGSPSIDSDYNDVWELLSDGSFSNAFTEQQNIQIYLYELLYEKDMEDISDAPDIVDKKKNRKKDEEKHQNRKRKYTSYIWRASEFKKLSESTLSIEEIMQLSIDQQFEILQKKLDSLVTNRDRKQYKNLLIFICGNIDSAYSLSTNTSEIDIDADILHERSKKINILDVKNCLQTQFKPEQIARLGNNHIIYPSLSKQNFNDLIEKILKRVSDNFFSASDMIIEFNKDVKKIIYDNSVFPTQGVRPVFSSIYSLIETQLPEFILKALEQHCSKIEISINPDRSLIIGKIGNFFHTKSIQLDIHNIRNNITIDLSSLIAVHEVGHAVAYMILFHAVPKQLCSNGISRGEGFIVPHSFRGTKEGYFKYAQISLAGRAAEEIVFGDSYITDGAAADIKNATYSITMLVRWYGMDGFIGYKVPKAFGDAPYYLTDIEETNPIIETILKEQKSKATTILNSNLNLFRALIKKVLNEVVISQKELFNIAKPYIPELKILPPETEIIPKYSKILNRFLEVKELK